LRNRKRLGVAAALIGAVAALAAVVAFTSRPAAAASTQAASVSQLTYVGTTSMAGAGSGSTADGTSIESSPASQEVDEDVPNSGNSAARVPSSGVPTPAGNGLASPGSEQLGTFSGLNHLDERSAGTGAYANTNFSLEPPDQALCVGGNFVVESVNDAIATYSKSGNQLTAPEALNQFYGLKPAINRATHVYGDFTSDPKCIYDSGNGGHFIVSILQAGQIPTNGHFDGTGGVYLAVSQTADPTGSWDVYHFDTFNDGGVCPCLGDQPLIGADANGVYITTNSFPFFEDGFNGAQVYAMSKAQLESGAATVDIVNVPVTAPADFDGGLPYSLQPAKTVPGAQNATDTEYFLSALDFNATLDNRIAVWKLTGTSTLGSAHPALHLTGTTLASEVYGQPPAAQQSSDGLFPLRDGLYGLSVQEALYGINFDNGTYHTELLNSNDDRMNEVVFDGHKLYGAVNTVVKTANGPTLNGVAWFVVDPSHNAVANQGYLSVNGENLMFPAFGVNKNGKGAIGVTIVGTDMHPSTAYAMFDGTKFGPLRISFSGPVADDGFTGYEALLPNATVGRKPGTQKGVARWGDYGATAVDSDGSIWLANETTAPLPERTILANWATQITHVKP
jgi:hypothetical protein